MPATIVESVDHLREFLDNEFSDMCVYVTSGGFDPIHVGHLRCIQETAKLAEGLRDRVGVVVVIVNGDGFLQRKKGFTFMPHEERMEIIAGIEGVDFVVGWDDGTQFVTGALEKLKPDYFTKGGDRTSAENVPEFGLCEEIGCKVLFNIGGGKVQSSSELVKNIRHGDESSHI
jgi:D-beta-D-heptose 7-phosphate kinase/D-beta-D-heptose 1-phosphate adenosyltransferase